ncbi:MAG: esterase [Oleiphilaceae bacterium]|nr:esterase [Oleiphilaceae bacterium]
MATKRLLYLHGFNSSPASEKANQTCSYFAENDLFRIDIPALPAEPSKAIDLLENKLQVAEYSGLIGSSLGGFYSLYLHVNYALPAVLINPAVRPYELLSDYIGINKNTYTGVEYEVKSEHMEQLLALDVDRTSLKLSQLFLLTESEDETLNYQEAALKLLGAKMYLSRGGDHSYTSFTKHLPTIEHFFNRISSKS